MLPLTRVFLYQTVTVEDLGLQVTWNGRAVEVIIPTSLTGKVCGVCGYFDNNPANDLTVGPAQDCTDNIPGQSIAAGQLVSGRGFGGRNIIALRHFNNMLRSNNG